ncbi:non-homologous end-joining DNA ligase [Anaerobacillus alkalidiazotrophicus]|uniref:non-homologous end-joining DNA ligase n=1 Tax=Anaerobacillus alkalidiazotrophicus TaxID=472963 RepID=UPI000A01AB6E|nr:non-homologous end-joining DNA ligase [Anaerobacillus alkalidiazotrophicus]
MGSNTHGITIDGEQINITNIDKILWPELTIKKYDYLKYLSVVAPFMLPFLKDRLLTVIRFPNGVNQESFYQKNCPDYAPPFVDTKQIDNINYIVCSKLATLFWLGNQAAIEFHIPYQTVYSNNPYEIVLDLDPPSQNEFSLAIEAALILNETFEHLKLDSFVKTSGNKGLQIYIPLNGHFTYEETRIFTSFIAKYLETKYPEAFTTERLKRKRQNRLYIDFLQHGEGKTIIAPYSLRGNHEALMATPLHWSEVTNKLHPSQFSMTEVIARLQSGTNPFKDFFDIENKEAFKKVLETIKQASY